jgi:hypothetical protein
MTSPTFERLRQDVRDIASTVDSSIVFIDGLVQRLRDALTGGNTDADVAGLADELEAAKLKLATAIAANTASEDDSDSEEPDHGPVDDSETAPSDGSPTVDPSAEPEGGEPVADAEPPADAGNVGGPDEASQSIAEDGPSFTTTSGNTPEQVAENEAGSEAVDEDGEPTA